LCLTDVIAVCDLKFKGKTCNTETMVVPYLHYLTAVPTSVTTQGGNNSSKLFLFYNSLVSGYLLIYNWSSLLLGYELHPIVCWHFYHIYLVHENREPRLSILCL